MSNEEFNKALNFAYFYLKFRPRTQKEIVKYLEKKSQKYHFSPIIIKKVTQHLIEVNLINDSEFISLFIQQRNSFKPKSKFILSQELIRFGVSKELIDQYFSEHETDEFQLAKKALTNRKIILSQINTKKGYQKAFNFLLRRGFSFEIVKKTIAELIDKE